MSDAAQEFFENILQPPEDPEHQIPEEDVRSTRIGASEEHSWRHGKHSNQFDSKVNQSQAFGGSPDQTGSSGSGQVSSRIHSEHSRRESGEPVSHDGRYGHATSSPCRPEFPDSTDQYLKPNTDGSTGGRRYTKKRVSWADEQNEGDLYTTLTELGTRRLIRHDQYRGKTKSQCLTHKECHKGTHKETYSLGIYIDEENNITEDAMCTDVSG